MFQNNPIELLDWSGEAKTNEYGTNMSKKKPTKEERIKQKQKKLDKKTGQLLISAPGGAAYALSEIYSQAEIMQSFHDVMDAIKAVHGDSLRVAESMLVSQAYVLNATFNTAITSARKSEYLPSSEYHANLALRAQNQCQRTLKTLLEYKNPKRATFIKQQNNLQINQAEEKKEKNIKPANELLEVDHDARLDTGTPQESIRGNQEVETVGEVHRAED